jgi:tRNA A37 threonylcarbamoyladenosine modification protein TsaB
MHDAVVIALTSPILVGIYKDGAQVERFESAKQSSDALPELFERILQKYTLGTIAYAKGPGSFMAIKIAYLYLKTLSIVLDIRLVATDAFYFNGNRPLKAVGKLYFVKMADTIETKKFETPVPADFRLPSKLNLNDFSDDALPYYGIGAVG